MVRGFMWDKTPIFNLLVYGTVDKGVEFDFPCGLEIPFSPYSPTSKLMFLPFPYINSYLIFLQVLCDWPII